MEISQTEYKTWPRPTTKAIVNLHTIVVEKNSRAMSMTGNERSYIKQRRSASTRKYIDSKKENRRGDEMSRFADMRDERIYEYLILLPIYNSVVSILCHFIINNFFLARRCGQKFLIVVASLLFYVIFCSSVYIDKTKTESRKKGVLEMMMKRGGGGARGDGGVTGVRTEEAFIRVCDTCFLGGFHSLRSLLLNERSLEVARSGLIEREISPQTNREVVMRKFLP